MANLEVSNSNNMLVFGSQNNFEQAQRMAKVLNSSSLVPQTFRGEGNLANCIIALEMANRIGMSPLMVMQNLYVVHGNPSWSSKFLIAALNMSGKFSPIRYEFKGEENTDSWACRVYCKDKTGEVLYGSWVSLKIAKDEGWYGKAGSKWKTMPQLMLQYRAAAFFQRTYAPEISMGMQTAEELEDVSNRVENASFVEVKDDKETIAQEIEEAKNDPIKAQSLLLTGKITQDIFDEMAEQHLNVEEDGTAQ